MSIKCVLPLQKLCASFHTSWRTVERACSAQAVHLYSATPPQIAVDRRANSVRLPERVAHISQSNVTKPSSSVEKLAKCTDGRPSSFSKSSPFRYGTQNFLPATLEGTWRNIWVVPASYFAKNTAFRQMIFLPSSCSMRTMNPNLLRIHWMQQVAVEDIQACQTQLLKLYTNSYNRHSYFISALQSWSENTSLAIGFSITERPLLFEVFWPFAPSSFC